MKEIRKLIINQIYRKKKRGYFIENIFDLTFNGNTIYAYLDDIDIYYGNTLITINCYKYDNGKKEPQLFIIYPIHSKLLKYEYNL